MAQQTPQQGSTSRIAYVFLGGALIVAAGAVYGIVSILNGYSRVAREVEKPIDTVTVVAASRTLYQGVAITNDDLFVVNVPPDYLPVVKETGKQEVTKVPLFSSRERVVGQVPRERILANEFIRPDRLADGSNGVGLNAVIPRGMRAISVPLRGSNAVSGFLMPGNYVDVLVTMTDEFGRRRTETILQAVFVLGVNSRAAEDADQDVDARGKQAPSVTFLVTPKQAEDVAFADEMGDISLTLRNVQDVNYTQLSGADLDELLARLKPRVVETKVLPPAPRGAPVPAADPGRTIIIIRGAGATVERADE